MRLLLDTHVVAWWWLEDEKLSSTARRAIGDKRNEVFVSSVTAWEMANKHRLGKWPEIANLVSAFDVLMTRASFKPLAITWGHARHAAQIAVAHRDPFDRMLAAQSMLEALVFVSADTVFRQFRIRVLWSGEMQDG